MAAVFDVADFLHPLDTSARRQLEAVPMLESAVKKYLSAVKERRTHQALLVNALRLGPHQLPDVYKMLPPICEAFGIAEPELYLMQGPANAMTVGHVNAAIVIYSDLLEDLAEDEIQAVIAHECGHIMAQHTLYRQMAAAMVGAGETVAANSVVGQAAGIAIQSTLANWYRKSEFTADRAAVAFFGDPEPLQRALFHLLGVPKWMPAEVSYSAFIEQAGEFDKITESKWDRFLARSLESGSSHPLPALRMRELTTWAQSPTFEQLMEIAKHGGPRGLACGQCGQRLSPEWRFCQFCGAAVPEIATTGTGDQREPV
jgi:Zn-dependent protease with chaperone function